MAGPGKTTAAVAAAETGPAETVSPNAGGETAKRDDRSMGDTLLTLATMAGRRRTEAQEALLEKIAGLLADTETRTPKERALIDDILVGLVRDAQIAIRSRLAEQISHLEKPPPLLLTLLLEDDAGVAGALIRRSPALDEDDLTAACGRSHGHRLAAAARPGIGMPVSAALVDHGEADVTLTLLRNETARLSQALYARIIATLGKEPAIAEALATREDLSEALAHELFWSVAGPLRRRILDRFAVRPEDVDRVLDQLVAEGYAGLKPAFDEVAVLGRDRLARFGPISRSLDYLRAGNLPDFAKDVARRLSISPQTVRRVLADPGGEAVAVICKALDLDRSQFTSLFLLLDYRRRAEARPVAQVDRISRLFTALDREKAIASMRLWDRVEIAGP